MVGVEVREEDLAQLDQADRRAQQLPLRALAAVEQEPLAAAAHEERRRRPLRGRHRAGGAEEDDVEVHGPIVRVDLAVNEFKNDVLALIRRDPDPGEHEAIRELWKQHSKAEDNRDLPGLIATLTEDCVYELVQTGHRWEGHEGAARFYGGLLGAFPDIDFQLTDIVIGPQGVCEEADVTGTHEAEWLGSHPAASASPGRS